MGMHKMQFHIQGKQERTKNLFKRKINSRMVNMKAIKVEMIISDDMNGEYFVTQVLPKLKEKYKLKQVHYHKCEYFEK